MINYQIQFDPEGGDLGRANFRHIEPLELHMILPHISHILECLYKTNNSRLKYVYAFEFQARVREYIKLIMLTYELPEHVQWYTVDGQNIFELRSASGGLVTNLICYLVTK